MITPNINDSWTSTVLGEYLPLRIQRIHKPWLPTPSQRRRFPATGWWSGSQRYGCRLAHRSSEHQHPAADNQRQQQKRHQNQSWIALQKNKRRKQSIPYIKHLNDRLCEAYDVHGHRHGVGEGKDETDGASELWPQAPGDQVVRPSWTRSDIQYCLALLLIKMRY